MEFATRDVADESRRNQLGEDRFAETGSMLNSPDNNSIAWKGKSRIGIGPVNEISVTPEGEFKYIRRLNGDQTHQGRHVRIPVGQYSILHVKLYEYK